MSHQKTLGLLAAAAFISTILLANWLTSAFGFVGVGFGLAATAGTYAAGFALALRDLTHDTLGRTATIGIIVAGAVLSFTVAGPFIAVASGVAFLLSELADLAVYSPLRRRNWAGAVVASNLVGAAIDTIVFIGIAFGVAAISGALAGQLVGKAWATLAYIGIGVAIRAVLRESKHAKNS